MRMMFARVSLSVITAIHPQSMSHLYQHSRLDSIAISHSFSSCSLFVLDKKDRLLVLGVIRDSNKNHPQRRFTAIAILFTIYSDYEY